MISSLTSTALVYESFFKTLNLYAEQQVQSRKRYNANYHAKHLALISRNRFPRRMNNQPQLETVIRLNLSGIALGGEPCKNFLCSFEILASNLQTAAASTSSRQAMT
ncbi:hypothetical protein CEXT_143271 [Caerostris extrusa]|uniref:Uncharacterized protein n=1 Tax=Caerostris extrusa TaxID=172846 RepID=A0AAV4QL47_CAEEX|nr:hypothetical protein CEXT_143271 [Caerostris extrusa]